MRPRMFLILMYVYCVFVYSVWSIVHINYGDYDNVYDIHISRKLYIPSMEI